MPFYEIFFVLSLCSNEVLLVLYVIKPLRDHYLSLGGPPPLTDGSFNREDLELPILIMYLNYMANSSPFSIMKHGSFLP